MKGVARTVSPNHIQQVKLHWALSTIGDARTSILSVNPPLKEIVALHFNLLV
jgi:hypothetical protein